MKTTRSPIALEGSIDSVTAPEAEARITELRREYPEGEEESVMGIPLFQIVTAVFLPVVLCGAYDQVEKTHRFASFSHKAKQILIGISFGVLAILATEFGIPMHDAVLNVRDAAPLAAGLVFAVLFAQIYFLVKKLVVENIQKINHSLSQITGGDLNVMVDVRSNEEFASLSDDINTTVDTLKHYIDEAAARIDKELEFARKIQHAALPSVFPPYPKRKDFSIYASMDTAKEVGGDFYDFYMLGEEMAPISTAATLGNASII